MNICAEFLDGGAGCKVDFLAGLKEHGTDAIWLPKEPGPHLVKIFPMQQAQGEGAGYFPQEEPPTVYSCSLQTPPPPSPLCFFVL
jgi:hypothetical protein